MPVLPAYLAIRPSNESNPTGVSYRNVPRCVSTLASSVPCKLCRCQTENPCYIQPLTTTTTTTNATKRYTHTSLAPHQHFNLAQNPFFSSASSSPPWSCCTPFSPCAGGNLGVCGYDIFPAPSPPLCALALASTTRLTSSANVSSMFTISRALVSINPQPLLRAHSSPSLAPIIRAPCKSHLLPATILTGGTLPLSSLFSVSMAIMSMK